MTSVAADTLNGLLTSRFLNIGDGVDDEMSAGPALHDNVISEYLSGRRVGWSKSEFSNDIFDDSVSIANLFAMAQQQDPDMYAMLSDSSESRREEMESQIALSRGTVGTVVTTTSGLSIGYILYLLRGGICCVAVPS
ncbi:MAG: hypothetical protein AB8B64_07170 [Granulosicoccus sp.]